MFLLCCTFTIYPLHTTVSPGRGYKFTKKQQKKPPAVARYLKHSFYSEANCVIYNLSFDNVCKNIFLKRKNNSRCRSGQPTVVLCTCGHHYLVNKLNSLWLQSNLWLKPRSASTGEPALSKQTDCGMFDPKTAMNTLIICPLYCHTQMASLKLVQPTMVLLVSYEWN